jgi:hypothetical protein
LCTGVIEKHTNVSVAPNWRAFGRELLPFKQKVVGSSPTGDTKMMNMETLKQIVNGTLAKLIHVCNGKAYYIIDTAEHSYQLEIDCLDKEWKDIYILPKYKAITLMRWIRKGIEKNNETFIMLK